MLSLELVTIDADIEQLIARRESKNEMIGWFEENE